MPDDRAAEAVQHLQQAALEFISAARALLDVAEEAVREPGGVMAIVAETVSGLAEAVGEAAPGWSARTRRAGATAGPHPGHAAGRQPGPDEAGDGPHGVEHITIS